MRDKTLISFNFPARMITFVILGAVIFTKLSFAATGMKITAPGNGSIVHPGQEITVTIAATEGFVVKEAVASIAGSSHYEQITALPVTFSDTVPLDAAGEVAVGVFGSDVSGNLGIDLITLNMAQTATLQSLEVEPKEFLIDVDWNGNIKSNYYPYISVAGNYSDGVIRDIQDFGTTYTSSNPAIVSVDNKGKIQVNKAGAAVITVSNSGVNANIPVTFKEPPGKRPQDTTPPVTQINSQPAANAAGWYNSDIAVSLNAADNEGGSGVKQIIYSLNSPEPIFVLGDTAQMTVAEEGINKLQYQASDNDGNYEDAHVAELKLDKTPPVTTAVISPQPDIGGYIRSLPVKVSFSATDNLSEVAFTTPEKNFTHAGTYQVEYYSRDFAGNTEQTKTVTVNIVTKDITPPKISLQLVPIKLKFGKLEFIIPNLYKLVYSASDAESGVKNIYAGLIMPDITNFKIKVMQGKDLDININEKEKIVIIHAPSPQGVLAQIKQGLLFIQNNQSLQLVLPQKSAEWVIQQKNNNFLFINAPKIIFKAQATDRAGNTATKQVRI